MKGREVFVKPLADGRGSAIDHPSAQVSPARVPLLSRAREGAVSWGLGMQRSRRHVG